MAAARRTVTSSRARAPERVIATPERFGKSTFVLSPSSRSDLIGVLARDHVIVAAGGYHSFVEARRWRR